MKNLNEEYLKRTSENYSEEKLLFKIMDVAFRAGKQVIYSVLILYYLLKSENVDLKNKAIIMGALGYFILPVDMVPDLVMGVGYTDDLGILSMAIAQVYPCIDEDIIEKASSRLETWFLLSDEELRKYNQKIFH